MFAKAGHIQTRSLSTFMEISGAIVYIFISLQSCWAILNSIFASTCTHLADAFVQSDIQIRFNPSTGRSR